MLFVIETILFFAGIWTIAKGRLPLFISGPQYQVEGRNARLLGIILILPVPVSFIASLLLILFFDKNTALAYASLVEIFTIIIVLVGSLVFIRRVGQPIIGSDDVGNIIGDVSSVKPIIIKKTQVSIVYAFIGILGPAAIVACPLAYIRAGQALRLINEYKVGESYRILAYLGFVIATITLLVSVGIMGVLFLAL